MIRLLTFTLFLFFSLHAGKKNKLPEEWSSEFVNIDSTKRTLAVFGSESCGASRSLKKNHLCAADVIKRLYDYNLVYIECDKKVRELYSIKAYPTYIFLDEKGLEIARFTSYFYKKESLFEAFDEAEAYIKELDKIDSAKGKVDYLYKMSTGRYSSKKGFYGNVKSALDFYKLALKDDASLKLKVEFLNLESKKQYTSTKSRSSISKLRREYEKFFKVNPNFEYISTVELRIAQLTALSSKAKGTRMLTEWFENNPDHREASDTKCLIMSLKKK